MNKTLKKTLLLKGKPVSERIRVALKNEVKKLKEKYNIVPKLVAILVGDDPASKVYINTKHKAFLKMN